MITTQIEGAIGRIILDRPEKLNAFNVEMYTAFAEAFEAHDADPQVRVNVLTGTGAEFCAGNDIASFAGAGSFDLSVLADREANPSAHAVDALIRTKKPLIAAVQGRAIGWGATMLLHCDCVIMEEGSSLLYPFVKIGLVPEACSSALLEAHVGRLRARKIIYDAVPLKAQSALAHGLATSIAASDAGKDEAMAIAKNWAQRPMGSLLATKALLNASQDALVAKAADEFNSFARVLADPETQAGFKAMMAKSGT